MGSVTDSCECRERASPHRQRRYINDSFSTVVVLDDRADAVAAGDEFAEAWREWLRLSNIMAVRAPGTQVGLTTVTAVLNARGERTDVNVSGERMREPRRCRYVGFRNRRVCGSHRSRLRLSLGRRRHTFCTVAAVFSPRETFFQRVRLNSPTIWRTLESRKSQFGRGNRGRDLVGFRMAGSEDRSAVGPG